MKEEGQIPKEPNLIPYFEAAERVEATQERSPARKRRGRKNPRETTETEHIALTDDQLGQPISEPPYFEIRRMIKDDAGVLNRTHPEFSALQKDEEWEKVSEIVNNEYRDGKFLLNALGAGRYIEPKVSMTIAMMREHMIRDLNIESTAELMLMDGALLAYYNTLRLQRMLGDLATQFERELFHDESMSVNLKNTGNLNVSNFKVEAMLNRASDKLMNLIERTNQMMIRNIKALRDLKMGNLSIKDDQIKRAQQQLEEMGETRNNRGRRSVRAPSGGVRPIRNTQAHRGQTNAHSS